MVVCHCRAVSDSGIRDVIESGSVDVDEVIVACGAGGRCTGCRETIEMIVGQYAAPEAPVAVA